MKAAVASLGHHPPGLAGRRKSASIRSRTSEDEPLALDASFPAACDRLIILAKRGAFLT